MPAQDARKGAPVARRELADPPWVNRTRRAGRLAGKQVCTIDRVDLPRSNAALGRAQRMLDDHGHHHGRHSADLDALRDRLPYVLDLLSG